MGQAKLEPRPLPSKIRLRKKNGNRLSDANVVAGFKARLKREAEGGKDRVASHPVRDIELMKPPAAERNLLRASLQRIANQWPNGRHVPPERTNLVARTAVIGHLLIIVAADANREAKGKVLIERALDMELGAALVVRRGIDRVDGDAERGGSLDAGLEAEVRIARLEIQAGPVQARERKRGGGILPGRDETGQCRVPVMLALLPAKEGGEGAVAQSVDGSGRA